MFHKKESFTHTHIHQQQQIKKEKKNKDQLILRERKKRKGSKRGSHTLCGPKQQSTVIIMYRIIVARQENNQIINYEGRKKNQSINQSI